MRARVADIVEHVPGLRTFILEPERAAPRFRPGQFLHLALEPWDPSSHWPDSRAFSVASAMEERSRLEITVSAVGVFTHAMMALNKGAEVWVKLPLGDFVVQPRDGGRTVLVAGGTGITPFLSLLRSGPEAVGATRGARIHILYGARTPDLLIHRRSIELAAEHWPGLSWELWSEDAATEGIAKGRLSARAAVGVTGGEPSTYYLAGPPAMIASLRAGLAEYGVDEECVRVDAWS